jgi:hypothetical protein
MQVLPVQVTNRCPFPLTTVPPNVIGVAARWYPVDADGQEGDPEVGPLAAFPVRIDPGRTGTVEVVLNAPAAGRYRLSLALQQVRLTWFGFRTDAYVDVVEQVPAPAEAPASPPRLHVVHDDEVANEPATDAAIDSAAEAVSRE